MRNRKQQFTTLLHHVYNPDALRAAYFALKRDASPGVDGETWRHCGEGLEGNLLDLSERLKRGAYRASRFAERTSRRPTGGNDRSV